jgi:hypothetical protein
LQDLETYVSGQFSSIINYAAARRSGEPISTADANEKCKASNQSNQLSALFPSTRPFTTHSTCNGI